MATLLHRRKQLAMPCQLYVYSKSQSILFQENKVENEKKANKKKAKKGKAKKAPPPKPSPAPNASEEASEEEPKKKKKKTRQKRKPKSKKNKEKREKERQEKEKKEEEEAMVEGDDELSEAEGHSDEEDINPDLDMSAWLNLPVPEPVLRALRAQGFSEPTPIQKEVLPPALGGGRMDILGAAETGSGKTLAFGIPILAGILADKEREEKEAEGDDVEMASEENPEGSDDEEFDRELISDSEFSDMSDSEAQFGCVKVVNDVKFDFGGEEESKEEEEEFYMPPMEVLENMEVWTPPAPTRVSHNTYFYYQDLV